MQSYIDALRVKAAREIVDEQALSSNICWFCSKPAAEKSSAAEIYLYRNYTTEFGLHSHRSQWEELCRKIPCCGACHNAHQKAESLSFTFAWLGGISGLLAGAIVPPLLIHLFFGTLTFRAKGLNDFLGMIWFGLVLTALIGGAIGGYRFGKRSGLSAAPDGKPKEYALQHPVIAPLTGQGWKFGKPD